MRVEEKASAANVLAARDRYVPRGISASDLVVARAWGARIWDADGREYLDFAGGIACQNLGHGPAGVVRAVHEQVDRYLHQRSEEHTSELQSPVHLVCRLLLEKKNKT